MANCPPAELRTLSEAKLEACITKVEVATIDLCDPRFQQRVQDSNHLGHEPVLLGLRRELTLHTKRAAPEKREAPPDVRAALDLLGLAWPLEEAVLRARYKQLAKQLHPDVNGGDRGAEERFKDVNRAYSLLRQKLGAATAQRSPEAARAAG